MVLPLVLAACDTSPSGPSRGVGSLPTPTEVAPELRFADVGAGWFHTCATATDGTVYCWGTNQAGELGVANVDGHCDDRVFYEGPCTGDPQPVRDAPRLHELDGSTHHSCGLAEDGRAWCWGFGLGGQLGTGERRSRASAAPLAGTIAFQQLSLSIDASGSCGLDAAGALYCWGPVYDASMGAEVGTTPTAMPAELAFQQVDVASLAGCGVADGRGWCWGSNWYGQLGVGSLGGDLEKSEAPVEVVGGHTFSQVVMSMSHACGLRTDGQAWCWGRLPGAAADAEDRYGPAPEHAGGPAFSALAAGGLHTCGLTSEGEAWCWGVNESGMLGDGTSTDRTQPTRVHAPAGVNFKKLALGGVHSCGLSTDGRLFCWGHNGFGQAGAEPGYLTR